MIHKRIYHPSSSYLENQQQTSPNGNFNNPSSFAQPRPQQPYYFRPQPIFWNQGTSLEDLVKSLAISSLKFQQETTHKDLENFFLDRDSLKRDCQYCDFKSGKQLEETLKRAKSAMDSKQQDDLFFEKDVAISSIETTSAFQIIFKVLTSFNAPFLPFPIRFAKSKKQGA